MKILHVISSLSPEGGGPGEAVRQFGRKFLEIGHTVEVASLDAPNEPWLADQPFMVHALGPSHLGYRFSPRLRVWLRENVHLYDVVIIDGLWQYSSFATWQILRRSRIPYYVFPHGMLAPWFKRNFPLKHLKKWLYWPWAEYRVLRDARNVLFTCEEERRLARESFWLYSANERVVNLGIAEPRGDSQCQKSAFLDRFPHLRGQRLLTFVGRIHPVKGCDLVIEAFANVAMHTPNLHLVMVGPDTNEVQAELQKLAKAKGVTERITWTGMLSGDIKWGAYQSAEAFILASHHENFGLAVVEALACGTPVLISNKVNIWREIIEDGAGIVADDNILGITNLLSDWLALTSQKQLDMRQCAKHCFEKRFEISRSTDYLLNILKEGSI